MAKVKKDSLGDRMKESSGTWKHHSLLPVGYAKRLSKSGNFADDFKIKDMVKEFCIALPEGTEDKFEVFDKKICEFIDKSCVNLKLPNSKESEIFFKNMKILFMRQMYKKNLLKEKRELTRAEYDKFQNLVIGYHEMGTIDMVIKKAILKDVYANFYTDYEKYTLRSAEDDKKFIIPKTIVGSIPIGRRGAWIIPLCYRKYIICHDEDVNPLSIDIHTSLTSKNEFYEHR